MIEQVTFIATILSVYGIVICGILLFRSKLSRQQIIILPLFVFCLVAYLLMDEGIFQDLFFDPFLIGAFLLPFSFWKLSQTIFSDKEQPLSRIGLEALIVVGVYLSLRATRHNEALLPYALLCMKLISITFLVLSVVESQKGKKDDLVKSRLKLRKTFIYFVAITGLITVMTETTIGNTSLLKLKMIQRLSILTFTSYFLVINSAWQEHFLGRRPKAPKIKNQSVIDRINELMYDQQFYKKEGLTIGQLASKLQEQEYKLRAVINQEMGYRNFPAFVNSFRITEAKELLLTNTGMTIQEVAFETGFNSIGPFNRSFKTETGLTPKVFRDQNGRQS